MGWTNQVNAHKCLLPVLWDYFNRMYKYKVGSRYRCDQCNVEWVIVHRLFGQQKWKEV